MFLVVLIISRQKRISYYDAFFKIEQVSWDTALICSLHLSRGRTKRKDMPDVRIPDVWKADGSSKVKKKERLSSHEQSPGRVQDVQSLRRQLFRAKNRWPARSLISKTKFHSSKIKSLSWSSALNKACLDLKERNTNLGSKPSQLESVSLEQLLGEIQWQVDLCGLEKTIRFFSGHHIVINETINCINCKPPLTSDLLTRNAAQLLSDLI